MVKKLESISETVRESCADHSLCISDVIYV